MLVISLALSNVEKISLGQGGDTISNGFSTTQRQRQGMLSDDLLQGKISEEVITLRARLYKVLDASDGYSYETGDRGFKTIKKISRKIKGEPSDEYIVEMIVQNDKISKDISDSMDNIDTKPITPIMIGRSILPKFNIEDYTEKLFIKDIDGNTKLIEFFISKYINIYDKKTSFLINDITRAMEKPKTSDFLDIDEIGFITHNTAGVKDFLEYKYKVLETTKIVEFGEHYVAKFICEPIINGDSIIEKYSNEKLNEKYNNNEKK